MCDLARKLLMQIANNQIIADCNSVIVLSAEPRRQKKGSKYNKSRKIKVLRDFLFLLSDIRKTRKAPFGQSTVTKSLLKTSR